MANIKVRLKDASKNVLHPETDWSVVLNKPSIFTYPEGAGTCIGDVSGFRIFFLGKRRFYVCATAAVDHGDYTLGFATPGGIIKNGSGKTDHIAAFFVNISNLQIDYTGIDSQHNRLNLTSGNIETTNALGILGEGYHSLLDDLAAWGTENLPINVDNTYNNDILPVNAGGVLCIGVFDVPGIEYGEYAPYLTMVTKLV